MKKRYEVTVTFYDDEAEHPNAQSMDDLNAGTVEEYFNTIKDAESYGDSFKGEKTYRGYDVFDKELSKTIRRVRK